MKCDESEEEKNKGQNDVFWRRGSASRTTDQVLGRYSKYRLLSGQAIDYSSDTSSCMHPPSLRSVEDSKGLAP